LLWDDEKKRLNESMNKYAAEIEELKKNLSTAQQHTAVGTDGIFRNIRTDAEDQVKSLSQQLLKKQSMVQDLLAERSALKVRVHDLETRCVCSMS
jgi:regulator of replication initiation timing